MAKVFSQERIDKRYPKAGVTRSRQCGSSSVTNSGITRSSASRNKTQGCLKRCCRRVQVRFLGKTPFQSNCNTFAPACSAIRTVPSELRESTTITSENAETEARQPGKFASSFRTGMQTETGRLIDRLSNFRGYGVPGLLLQLPNMISGSFEVGMASPFLYHTRRVSGDDLPGCHISHYDCPSSNDRPFGDCYARPDKRIRANPCLISDVNRRFEQWHGRIAIIV